MVLAVLPILLSLVAPIKVAVEELGGPAAVVEDVVDVAGAVKEAHDEVLAAHEATSDGGDAITAEEAETIAARFIETVSTTLANRAGFSIVKEAKLAKKIGALFLPHVFKALTEEGISRVTVAA